jgi:arylsulfatase A-like enzyme
MNESGRSVYGVFPGEVLRWAGRTLITRGLTKVEELKTDRDTPDQGSHSASMETAQAGLKLLAENGPEHPLLLWLHFFDVHEHLQLPSSAPSIAAFLGSGQGSSRRLVEKYRATLKFVDGAIGVVIDELHAQNRWDKTIIVLASDHGESLLEDPRLPKAHGLFVYNPLTHVPLSIRIPGMSPGKVSTPVALADLTPTLATLTGTEGMEETEAHTLLHHLIDDEDASLQDLGWPILQHEQNQWGIIDWPYKLMVRPEENLKELYDLSTDFKEKRDLSFLYPEKIRALEALRLHYPPFRVVRTMTIIRDREEIAERPEP